MNELEYYEMQQPNLLYPNERYINSVENKNKADLYRMQFVFDDMQDVNKAENKMLDIGCNDGFFMRHFDWKFSNYLGVDMFSISDYLKTSDIGKYTKQGKIEYLTGIFEKMELKEKFDFIFAGKIVEHVIDVDVFLKAVDSVLGENGHVCLTTPNNIGAHLPEHFRQYDKITLKDKLSQYFEVEKLVELPAINDSWPFLYARCKKGNV